METNERVAALRAALRALGFIALANHLTDEELLAEIKKVEWKFPPF